MTLIHQQKNTMSSNKKTKSLLLVCILVFAQAFNAQPNFDVNSNLLGNFPNRFDYELTAALNYLQGTGTTATIRLNVPNNTLIQLTSNIAPINIPAGKTLRIIKHPNAVVQNWEEGFDATFYNVMPFSSNSCQNGFCWTPALYGLNVFGDATSNFVIDGVKFHNFNKFWFTFLNTYTSYIVGNLGITNFPQFYNQPCSGGPPCLLVYDLASCEIKNCKFENYTLGVHYSRIRSLRIKSNSFITDASYGSSCTELGIADAILFKDLIPNTFIVDSKIEENLITANPNTLDYPGTGIIINPCNWPFGSNLQANVNANLKFNIHLNTIRNCSRGIVQEPMHPNRTTPDNTYDMNIHYNNFLNAGVNVQLGGPYRHFKLENCTLGLKSTYPSPMIENANPAYLSIGTYSIANSQIYVLPIRAEVGNAFGFKMIYPNNTLNMGIANSNNTFQFINNPQYSWDPAIITSGDFKKEVDFVGDINFNGYFEVGSGKNTNIRECTNTLNGREIGSPPVNSNIAFVNPIVHNNIAITVPLGTPPNFPKDASNGNLAGPTLKNAQIESNKLKIAFDLIGNNIVPANGPFVVEFYKSDATGALVDFIGRQTISTLTGFTYSLTVFPTTNVNLSSSGERIAATITSLGTANNQNAPLGTSTVSYIYALPCNDCISDFAPIPGKEYIASSWVKRPNSNVPSYSNLFYRITFYSATQPNYIQIGQPLYTGTLGSFVDGWQKLDAKFMIPSNAVSMKLEFYNDIGISSYFDDIRVFPVDATMKSYAYDPDNLRLMGELDENNYATFYEYDEEGKLIRVKKETEKGIMTIKESRNNKPTK